MTESQSGEKRRGASIAMTDEELDEFLILETVERLHATKYAGGTIQHDGRHAWLRINPDKVVSWDFRKRHP